MVNSMKSLLKKWLYYVLPLVLGIIIISAVYALQDVAPLGKNSLLTIDFFHQYGPMLAELRRRVLNGTSLIYSFNMGMGLPFFRNFFNYLSSPINILLVLFKHKDILMSYSVIIGLKAALSALTMSIFLRKKVGKNYAFVALSLLYAFSAYFTAYYWNIMWLDGMVMLPLIALGIDKLVKENKILFYVISLAVMLFTNYFIGYMLCIFSVLYFIISMVTENRNYKIKSILKKGLSFGGASLLAGGLCALFLIPLFMGIKDISATGDVFPTSQYYAFSFKEFFFNHFSGVGSTVLKSGITTAPNISIGVISIPLLLLFIINPKIKVTIKASYLLFLLFLIISFRWAPLDFIWHAFHVPNDLPYRYSFIYSFVLTLVCAYSIKNIKNIKPLFVGISFVLTLVLITLMKTMEFANINNDMLIVNYIIITIFYLCYLLYFYFRNWNRWSICFMIIATSLECVMAINNNWMIDQNIEGFYSDYNQITDNLEFIKNQDNGFFRTEKLSMLTFNDPSWYGYNGQVTFSSMEYENMAILQHNLGMPSNEINSYYYKDTTPVYNMMFDMKYLLGDSLDTTNYTQIKDHVYKFNNSVGLMFGVNDDVKLWKTTYTNPISNQNEFIRRSTNIDMIFDRIDDFSKEVVLKNDLHTIVKYTIPNFNDNYYIVYPDNAGYDFIFTNGNLYYDGDDYKYAEDFEGFHIYSYSDCNEKYIISEKTSQKYITVFVGYSFEVDNSFSIYKLNTDKFNTVYDMFIKNKVDLVEFKEHYIKAKSNLDKDMLIYTSIPYDLGWKVYVDGKETNTYSIGNALLGYDMPKGDHVIELVYKIPYFKLGLGISLTSLGLLVIWQVLKKD